MSLQMPFKNIDDKRANARRYWAENKTRLYVAQREYVAKRNESDPEFRKQTLDRQAEWARRNPEKKKAIQARNEAKNGERNARSRRNAKLKHDHGITVDEYEAILENQSGGCAICGSRSANNGSRTNLFVDHCHETSAVRGLLCNPCNLGLGNFMDNPELLIKAANYVDKSRRTTP